MKRKSLLFLLLLALLAPWTAKAQTTYTADQAGIIGTGTSAQVCAPIDLYYKSFLNQSIYTADEIGLEGKSATIKTISFQYDYTTSYTSNSFTLYLGNTTKSSFSSNTDWVTTGNMTNMGSYTVTTGATAGAWVTITLSSTFSYTGDNLVVCLFDNNIDSYPGSSSSDWRYTTTSDYKFIYYRSDSSAPSISTSTSGTRSYSRPNIKLNIGGTSASISSATFYDSGGSSNNYSIYEDYIWTFYPSTTGSKVVLDLTSFASEASWDYFRVYDGENTSATNLLNYAGTSLPGTTHFVATNSAGAITVWWHSDSSNTYAGWAATLSQLSQSYTITVWPNNSSYGSVSGGGTYTGGSSCTITATPASGYIFDSWIMNGTQTINTNPYTLTVSGDADFQAVFSADPCPSGTRTIDYALTDSYGDGWNGASITVVDGCGTLIETLTISSGSSNSGSFNLCANYVEFIWNSGNYDGECDFTFTEGGTTLFTKPSSVSDGMVLYTIGTLVPAPTSLTAGTPSTNSVVLNWTENGTASSWQICINSDETNLITANSHTNYTLSNLQADTQYSVKVRAYINASSQSCWSNTVTFTTAASNCPKPTNLTVSNLAASHATVSWDSEVGNYTVKYSTATVTGTTLDPVFEDGFEDGLGSWTTYANDYVATTSYTYNITDWHQQDMSDQDNSAHTGSYVAMSRSYDGHDRSVDNWLVSPQMTLGDVVKFWVLDDGTYHEYYEVYVSTGSAVVPSSGTGDFQKVAVPALASNTWSERTVDISAYSGQTGYVAIRHHDAEKDWLLVDDFGVYNTINTYSYGGWTTVSPNPTTESCPITGLSAETLYAVQVQANCGGTDGSSAWSTIYFTTPDNCGAPQELASSNITATSATLTWADDKDSYNLQYRKVYFYEDFEGETLPTGWTTIDANNDGLTWGVGHATAHSGHNGAYNVSYVYNTTGTTPNDYLVSPQLDLQGTLRVWLSGYPRSGSNYSEHFAIYLSTTENTVSDFTTTLVGETTTTNGYVEYTADLSSYAGQQGYIAIRHFNCSDQYYLYVDDFGLYGSENWVTLSPNPTTETANLTGLTPNTGYEWQVQGVNCDGNDGTTDWSAPATFTTPEAYTVTLNSWPESIGATLTGDGLQSVGSHTISAEAPSGYRFVNWTSTDGNVVSSIANYTFNLTGDITLQANFTMTTTTSLPWTEGFESYTYSGQGLLNGDWATPLRVGSCPNVEYYPWGAPSGNYAMHMDQNSSNYSMAVFPQFDEPLNTLLVEFTCARGGDGTTGEGVLGYVTDPSDGSTFVALVTMAQPNSVDSYSSYSYNLTTISNAPNNANYRLAIRYKNSGQVWYFDDFSVKVATHTLTASVSPSEGGTISDNGTTISGNVEYNDGTSVTLTANAATGYTFQNWTIDGSTVANNPTTITMDQDHTVVANFTLNQYTVSVSANPSEGGTVAGGNTYSHGVTATLTATANTGYTFVNWTKGGNEVSTEATYSFTVTEAGEYVANFEANLYTLTVAVDPAHAGSVTVDPVGTPVSSSATYTVGTGELQKANAPCGRNYTFVEMLYTKAELTASGASAGSISSIAFNRVNATDPAGQVIEVYMKATTEFPLSSYISIDDADLVRTSYTLTAPGTDGWVTIPLSAPFNWDGESNVLVAVNKTNTSLETTNWYNEEGKSILFNSSSEIVPTNLIEDDRIELQWRPNIQFTITPASTTYQYAYGTEVVLTATANSGYYFYNWTDGSNNTYNGNTLNVTVTEDMAYTAHFVNYKRFVTDGSWNEASNWEPAGVPTASEDVAIEAAATIYNGKIGYANVIRPITHANGSITIKDGGQLVHNNASNNMVTVTVENTIASYDDGGENIHNKGYEIVSFPVENLTAGSNAITGAFTQDPYDFYRFDANADPLEWIHMTSTDNISLLQGFIYASQNGTTIRVTGPVMSSENDVNGTAVDFLNADAPRFNGWALLGNPFVCNAYVSLGTGEGAGETNFYKLNHTDDYDEFVPFSSGDAVTPMGGVMFRVYDDDNIVYSRAEISGAKTGILNMDVNRASVRGTVTLDRARIRFGEGRNLEKFQFDTRHTKVYIPEGGNDFSVYYADGAGTIPVNFKAQDNGRYTLDFSTEDVGFNYLHLIDNMNGNDVDLLQTPYYTFDAKSTDFASRFTLVFATGNDNDDTFAFFNNGVWIINNDGDAELQVIDVLGHILSSETISGSCSKAINAAPGVFMLRLINGNDVKVQKVVVRR